MKSVFILAMLVSVANASALTLKPGQSSRIGNAVFACEDSSTKSRCGLSINGCFNGGTSILIDGWTVEDCVIGDIPGRVQAYKDAGLCQ